MSNDQQVDFIRKAIDGSGISMQELKDDLLDHFCCFAENEMKKGSSFEAAYTKAVISICPNGFEEIQKETIYLLNSKRISLMKKLMYAVGLLASVSASTGLLFKILHMPGADELFAIGIIALAFIFLPMFAIDRYKFSLNKVLSEKIKIIFGFISAVITAVGVALRMVHITEFGNLLFTIGVTVFIAGYLPFFFFRMYRKAEEAA